MSIVTNLELMRLEPRLFTDAADSGLTLLSATDGVISDNVLTSAGSDFVATGVSAQDIVVVTGEAIEIKAKMVAASMGDLTKDVEGEDFKQRMEIIDVMLKKKELEIHLLVVLMQDK